MGDGVMKKQLLAVLMAGTMLVPATAQADELVNMKSNVQTEEETGKVEWVKEGDKWYYYDYHGRRMVDWLSLDNKWYYLGSDGAMRTDWVNIRGSWYYMNADGVMQTGWLQYGGTWYYLNESGAMQTGWMKYGEDWYYMNRDGSMKTGWLQDGGNWYYLHPSGKMEKYWLDLNGKSYIFDNGVMQTGPYEDGYYYYLFGKDGAKITNTGWIEYDGNWYYLKTGGELHVGELKYGGDTYFFTPEMATGWVLYNEELNWWNYYEANGKAKNGWLQHGGSWYYLVNGEMQTGWLQEGNSWYYLQSNGEMATGEHFIDGTWYAFYDNGVLIGG